MSMIAFLPAKNEKLSNVIRKLSTYSITKVLEILENAVEEFPDADVQVYLPRFKIESDLNLNGILDKVRNVFFCTISFLITIYFSWELKIYSI